MMGDNRPDSDDSRFWGPVRRSWLIGQVFFSYCRPTGLEALGMARSTAKKPKGAVASVVELVVTVAVAIGLALLIQAFIVKPTRSPVGR